MDSVLAKAIARRKKLEAEIAKIDAFIEVYKELSQSETSLYPAKGSFDIEVPAGRIRSKKATIIPVVKAMLAESTRPIPPSELVERLSGEGIEVGGKNPAANLSAMLSHAEGVRSTGRGWVLTESAEEESKQDAENDSDLNDLLG